MTARLGYPPADRQSHTPNSVNIFGKAPETPVLRASALADLGYLGHGAARSIILKDFGSRDTAGANTADRIPFEGMQPPLSAEEAEARDLAELDREETALSVSDRLPRAFGDCLRQMPEFERRRREAAILKRFGEWRREESLPYDFLDIVGMDVLSLGNAASTAAWRYSETHPADKFTKPEHRKRRCEKWWRKRLGRLQKRALGYVEAVAKALGGPNVPGRALNVSDYTLARFREHRDRTREIMEGLLLIQKPDPTVQIPMIQVDTNAKAAKAAKMRLWIDMNLRRWAKLGWRICWITVTLPGKYVCHATNEEKRVSTHDLDLGPMEAMQEIQDRHHRVMALLRSRDLRPQGWWNAQPQQSGTVHRHYVIAVPTLEDARRVCDGFRDEFSSLEDLEGEGEDRGCAAYVIGDDDERYKPRKAKNGKEESAESVAKYASRYSARCEGLGGEDEEENEDQDRFSAWKWLRGARTHAWLGLDSSRAPGEIWDTLWAHLTREERRIERDETGSAEFYYTDDARMALALRQMRECARCVGRAVEIRKAKATAEDEQAAASIEEEAQAESADAALHAWQAAVAAGIWPDRDLAPEELDWLRGETMEWNGEADALPPCPLREVRESVYEEQRSETVGIVGAVECFRLSAKPRREELLEAARAVGVDVWGGKTAGFIMKELKQAGFRFSKRPDGSLVGFDLSGEILLRHTEEWEIVDKETAAQRVEEHDKMSGGERSEGIRAKLRIPEAMAKPAASESEERLTRQTKAEQERIWQRGIVDFGAWLEDEMAENAVSDMGVSFTPTDPSYGPAGLTRVDDGPPG